MDKPQYAWKQKRTMKTAWFPDKETCLKHCDQHKSAGIVYLYKQVLIPQGCAPFINRYQSFRWTVIAHSGTRELRILQSPRFRNLKNCLRDFENMLREGYNVEGCETTHYLVMRRPLGDRKRPYFLRHLERPIEDSLDISDDHTGLDHEE